MNMYRNRAKARAAAGVLGATLALAALSAPVMAAETAAAEQERRMRELEDRVRQEDARREMEARTRAQEQALRGQQESIRRLEEARARLERTSQEVAQLSSELGRNYTWSFSTSGEPPRALLGVSVGNAPSGRDGALVRNVSPGGAAEVAGIRAGDVITALNGEDLTKDSDPARALVEKMRTVDPDAKVKVDVLRDGKKMSFDVTARTAPQPFGVGAPGIRVEQLRDLADRFERNPPRLQVNPAGSTIRQLSFMLDGALAGMELATMSDRLGDYFGVDTGVLVVRAGADAPFGLQDGDVILSIDGRVPTEAQHAGRILRSYQPGEKVKLRVQRDRKAIDLDTTAPGGRGN